MQEIRKKKVESLLREQISNLIQKGEIKDPRINRFVIITKTDISKDLREAKIFISYLGSRNAREKIVNVLNNAAGFIQGKISKKIHLRSTPHLTFYLDNSLENAQKIDDLFTSINKPDSALHNEEDVFE